MYAPTDKSGKADGKWWMSTECLRFILAMVIILGFLIILGIAMLGGYADVPTMAGIFSGWIVAIVAFYFMEQASDRAAHQQEALVMEDARKKLDSLLADTEENIDIVGENAAIQVDYWKNKAMEFRNLLIEMDPSLKSE